MVTSIDTWLFLRLNVGLANPVLDRLMPFVTEFRHWLPLIVVVLAALAIRGGGRGRSAILVAILLVVVTDQLSSSLIKPWIARIRPCHVVEGARVIYRCGNTWAFPSSHAVNTMAAAIFFGLAWRRWLWPLVAASVLISVSRVYIGIHYPFDVMGGWLIGGILGWGTYRLWQSHLQRLLNRIPSFRCDDRPHTPAEEDTRMGRQGA